MGSTTVLPPKCATCQLGKQERTPKQGTTLVKEPGGALKMNKLEPGDLVFLDQYESPLLGQQFLARGVTISRKKLALLTRLQDAPNSHF
jgi:hypothetical protein